MEVEVIEIWQPTNEGGQAVRINADGDFENMELVAYLVSGSPIILKDGYVLERKHISEEEAEQRFG